MALDAYIGSTSFSLPPLEQLTLTAFSFCNSIRILAYIPQIRKAAMDKHGADAISYTTWSLFLIAHLSTIAYALVNQADVALALCFAGNALCCLAILVVAIRSKLRHLREHRHVPGRRADAAS